MRKLEDQLGITPIAVTVAQMTQETLNFERDLQEGFAKQLSGALARGYGPRVCAAAPTAVSRRP